MILIEAIAFQLSILEDRKIRAEVQAVFTVNTRSAPETTRDFILDPPRGKSTIDLLKCSDSFHGFQSIGIISDTLIKEEGVDLIKRGHFLKIHPISLIGTDEMSKRKGWTIPELMASKLCLDILSFEEA
jgi:hypothetical protein